MKPRGFRALLATVILLTLLPVAATKGAPDGNTRHLMYQDGRQLEVLISAEFTGDMQSELLIWIEYIAEALRQVYGHWPAQHWQITVAPTAASASDPIPWAQVHRGDINSVEFFTSTHASGQELQRAWTSYHELAHLLIPYRGWGDAWFIEGLASYYQYILQARMGLISEREMWQKIHDGFQRGRNDTSFDGESLRGVSDNMRENGGFMRVYWSGAVYFLAADTRLRLESGGALSLDKALGKLNDCCADQSLSVPQIVAKLDQLNGVTVFGNLYDEFASTTTVPAFDTIFATLGIDVVDGEVQLQETGPGARLRREFL
tara:strand:- start:405378 stop:406331 length:954 start_codon:yes stop_codon:yes gene_type:complete